MKSSVFATAAVTMQNMVEGQATHAQIVALVAAAHKQGGQPHRLRQMLVARDMAGLKKASGNVAQKVSSDSFVIAGGDSMYPQSLMESFKPPALLYGQGDATVLLQPGVLIAGALGDDVDTFAEAAAAAASEAQAGVVCVAASGSGLIAARAAIQFQTPVVLVLATGPDSGATHQTRELAEEVVATGGCVVSEYPFGATSDDTFGSYQTRIAARLRIAAGLASTAVITGGDIPSDTANVVWATARLKKPIIAAGSGTDQTLVRALTSSVSIKPKSLVAAGCPKDVAERIAATEPPLANVFAEQEEDLSAAVLVMHKLH